MWHFVVRGVNIRAGRGALLATLLPALLLTGACSPPHSGMAADQQRIEPDQLLADVEALAAESMEGRRTGTEGHERARDYIVHAFRDRGLEPMGDSFLHSIEIASGDGPIRGWNIIARVDGTEEPDRFIVVTGHYDHLGFRNDQLFPGADDNASGAAAVIALAGYFRSNPPRNSILFMTPDAEERGLRGARAFVEDPPVPLEAIMINVNADMISHNARGELYAAGGFHYPFLDELLDRAPHDSDVTLLRGHDRPGIPAEDDWTMLSDHGAFHEAGIPFMYFGVEDHAHYHKPSDVFEIVHPDFYHGAVETILSFLLVVDEELDRIAEESGRAVAAPAGE